MTEREWRESSCPARLLEAALRAWHPPTPGWRAGYTLVPEWNCRHAADNLTAAQRRKVRLAAAACFRDLWAHCQNVPEAWRVAASAAEHYAEGAINEATLSSARDVVLHWREARVIVSGNVVFDDLIDQSMPLTSPDSPLVHALAFRLVSWFDATSKHAARQADLLREVLGDPPGLPDFDDAWRTPAVRAVAAAISKDGLWDDLPVLSDALEEAGCADELLLGHLRGRRPDPACRTETCGHHGHHDGECWLDLPCPHVRGCWALDLVLGLAAAGTRVPAAAATYT